MASLRYRNPNSPRVLGIQVLKPEDLEFLREKSATPTIIRLRESHHRIAMLLALGLTIKETADRVGYSAVRVSFLAGTPTMKDLIARYRQDVNEATIGAYRNFSEEKADIAMQGVRKIKDRFDEDDEAAALGLAPGEGLRLRDRDLASITANMLDSIGHGKISTNVNVNVGFAARLEEARQRAAPKVVDAKAVPTEAA